MRDCFDDKPLEVPTYCSLKRELFPYSNVKIYLEGTNRRRGPTPN
jgi:hypothetical protein